MRVALLLVLVACTKAPRSESRGAADAAPADVSPRAPAVDAAPDCFAQCMRDSQARAVSIDQIERDCRAQCSAAPPVP